MRIGRILAIRLWFSLLRDGTLLADHIGLWVCHILTVLVLVIVLGLGNCCGVTYLS